MASSLSWRGFTSTTVGTTDKDDEGKPRTDLLPAKQLLEVAAVFGFGAKKYKEKGYMVDSVTPARIYAALLRHALAYGSGEQLDKESGYRHLAHVVCCALMLMEKEDARTVERGGSATGTAAPNHRL